MRLRTLTVSRAYFFIIFSSFCIFVPLPLAAPASSLFLHVFFISRSLGLEAEARLFISSSSFLHLRWKSGPKGRRPGGGEAKTRSLFVLFIFLQFFMFSSFYSSFFLRLFLHLCHHFFFIFEVSPPQIFIVSSFLFPPSLMIRALPEGGERRCRTMRK